METTAGVAAATTARGASLQMPPSSRKEWRAIGDQHSARNPGDEELSQPKIGQSDERTIFEVQQGREPLDVDFCSITVDGALDSDIMQQRILNVARQREELGRVEIELRAQMIARTGIMEMQSSFDAQLKEQANTTSKLQEQLLDRERRIHELEGKMEEKDRELHAIKLENEAAWAKQDLLREQNKELATFRREHDHSEAERAQHVKQIHDLQEHIQEKERQLIELQEQHRVAQETVMYKDEQLREAQAWIASVREVDVFQSTTNQTLQAELRERTEQYNQLWMAFQRQFAEMERVHLHAVHQLQLELADARERSGAYNDDSRMSQTSSKQNASQFGQDNGNQFDANGSSSSGGNNGLLPNENSDNGLPLASSGNASIQNEHVPSIPIAPSSLLGMPPCIPPSQVTAMHPFFVHQQAAPHSVASHVPQSQVGHFHSVPAILPPQQWQNQQAISESSQVPVKDDHSSSQTDQNLMRSDAKFNYEMSVNGQALSMDYLDVRIGQGEESQTLTTSSAVLTQSVDKGRLEASQPDQSLQQISSHFHDVLRLNTNDQNSETKVVLFAEQDENVTTSASHGAEDQVLVTEQSSSAANASSHQIHSVNHSVMTESSADSVLSEASASTGHMNLTVARTLEAALLDERALLACIVRTIPAGGRIRISSTLPNRLGKMLAPLRWHDYKKKYGRLDDFVANHPQLFMIEGDYIQLREGAQKMVAATAAVAKVAAAAAASPPYSSYLPTVAVTPMAQSHRLKKVPSIDSRNVKTDNTVKEYVVISQTTTNDPLKLPAMQQPQQPNGMCFSVTGGLSNVKILSKSKDSHESRPVQSSVHLTVGIGVNLDRSSMSSTQNIGSANGRLASSFSGKQQTRKRGDSYL
ncbi:uncharacterized protein LOC129302483 isoform X1 [Prosopis cineraria]|uniref:uncharacterized protein LOC129302483 isoform X1 n=2 Tax=Prosopis cineraria TaxID=364024 RepID=UPI00240F913C|nr:uncharacterized protein LOC129302483 isoform X1 [Prosopis cineraria]